MDQLMVSSSAKISSSAITPLVESRSYAILLADQMKRRCPTCDGLRLMNCRLRNGFSLVELLVTLGIIALLAGLILPILSRARKNAHQTSTVSNLHQCAIALMLYAEDYGGISGLPDYSQARWVLDNAPTCDPEDTFRKGCDVPTVAPLIGSYAYLRGTDGYASETEFRKKVESQSEVYLLASVFYGDRPPRLFDGNDQNPCIAQRTCRMPTRLIRALSDGSVKVTNGSPGAQVFPLFTWEGVFEIR